MKVHPVHSEDMEIVVGFSGRVSIHTFGVTEISFIEGKGVYGPKPLTGLSEKPGIPMRHFLFSTHNICQDYMSYNSKYKILNV